MAVDDITTILIANAAQNTTSDRQPAAGVEELYLAAADVNVQGTAPNKTPSAKLQLIDGTNNQASYFDNSVDASCLHMMYGGKMVADNTNFFRHTHTGAGTGDFGFAVIDTG